MKDYRLFDISDFALDDDFIRWVNEGKKADNEFWNDWLTLNPDKYMVVAEARKIVESVRTEEVPISVDERESEINRLLLTIGENSNETKVVEFHTPARSVSIWKKRRPWAAAAIIIAVLGITSYFFQKDHIDEEQFTYRVVTPLKHLVESVNTSGKTISLTLPDGSVVELAPDSRIGYPNNFDSADSRDVYLSGEAFFKVTKNPARPFRVFANEIVTKVLGTSFIVRSFEKDTVIQVTVKTGKVRVYSQASEKRNAKSTSQLGGIILTPNQELVYKKSEQRFQKSLIAEPTEISPRHGQVDLLYEEVSVDKLFSQLSKSYGINITYDVELLKKCSVTADLRNEPFYRKLDLICKAIGAEYEIIDGQIVIVTNGCD